MQEALYFAHIGHRAEQINMLNSDYQENYLSSSMLDVIINYELPNSVAYICGN